jgi:hypothetical protein
MAEGKPAPERGKRSGAFLGIVLAVLGLGCAGWALLKVVVLAWRAATGKLGDTGYLVLAGVATLVLFIVLLVWRSKPMNAARLRHWFGKSRGVGELAKRLGVPEAELRAAKPSYRVVFIRKRSGGTRKLHVPDPTTKALQRKILRRVLAPLRASRNAYGFEAGRSISHHAAQHMGRALVLRFDVVDFFPTTHAGRVERMFYRIGWSSDAAALLARLTTHAGGLPQGAPTSPRLSNLVNRGLDHAISDAVERRHGRYSRYADDITISFPEDWIGSVASAKATVKRQLARRGYRLHERKKQSVRRRHERQVVTGLVVNAHVALPRALRRKLRAARHHLATGRAATWTAEQLRGWEAFEKMVREQGAQVPEPFVRKRRPPWNTKRYRP